MEFNEKLANKLRDKNFQNYYPLALESLKVRNISGDVLEWSIYLYIGGLIFKMILQPLFANALNLLTSIINPILEFGGFSIPNDWSIRLSQWDVMPFITIISKWLLIIYAIMAVIYLAMVYIRKTKYYEFDIFKNDGLALSFKRQLFYKTRFNANFKNKIKDIDNAEERRKKQRIAKLIKKSVIQVNSRMDVDGEGFFREFTMTIKRDNETRINEDLETVISDLRFSQALHEIADTRLHESIAFSNLVNLEKVYRISATKGYSKDYLSNKLHIEFEEDKENEKTFHYSMPLSLIEEDSSEIIAEKKKEVLKWARSFEKNISFTMNTSKERATLDEIMAGDTSVIYLYTLPQNASINIASLEQNIQNNTKMKGIVAKLEAGVLQISVPVPDRLAVPVDFVTLLESTFGVAE